MNIPPKKTSRFPVAFKVVVLAFIVSLLIFIWGRLNEFSSEVEVDLGEFIVAEVKKGDLIREVRAPGTLVPIDLNFVSATSNGRVKEILLEASDPVKVGTVIMVLDNPELTQAVEEAKLEVEVLQSSYNSLKQRWQQTILKQRIVVADYNTRYQATKLRREANQKLLDTGAVSKIAYNESLLLENQLKFQHKLEVELLESMPMLSQAELTAAQAKTNKANRQLMLRQKLADDLYVKSSRTGILQEVSLREGEPFQVGTVLARIAEQDNLKARLRVQESQVKEVLKGQNVVLSAGGKKATGVVKRINPTVKQGAVIVDVYFTGDTLVGARPDLRIDGVIELEQIKNVLKVKRPVFSQEFSSGSLFVLNKAKTYAERKQVSFGKSSVDVIEIQSNLNIGDQVIVSSTNKYNKLNRIALR